MSSRPASRSGNGRQQDYPCLLTVRSHPQGHTKWYSLFLTLFLIFVAYYCTSALKGYDVGVLTGSGAQGREDGRADACSFNYPSGMVVDEATHSCFVVDYGNHLIRKISFVD